MRSGGCGLSIGFDPLVGSYNIPFGLRVGGVLDVGALGWRFGDVVGRHEVLRTVFPEVDGVPFSWWCQWNRRWVRLDFGVVDGFEGLESAANGGFDLVSGFRFGVQLLAVSEVEHVLVVVVHHIAEMGIRLRCWRRIWWGVWGAGGGVGAGVGAVGGAGG